MAIELSTVRGYFLGLQSRVVARLEAIDGMPFRREEWTREEGGGGISRVIEEANVFERGGVNFSHVTGKTLPPSATAARPELAGRAWDALGVSLVLHPRNPYAPTVHMNVRFFVAHATGAAAPVWWFGGGMDLTPYYGYADDAIHFHGACRDALAPFGADVYARYKKWCDEYFFLKHRAEPRGIGGIFFDYLGAGAEATAGQAADTPPSPREADPEAVFAFVRDVGDAILPAYLPIVERRRGDAWGDRERRWQTLRRGRYVEFNLLYDRGTVFGLRTDGRVESILMSMPPEVRWEYAFAPEPGTPEAESLAAIVARKNWALLPG